MGEGFKAEARIKSISLGSARCFKRTQGHAKERYAQTARGRRHCEAWVIATRAAFAYLGMSEKVSKAVSPTQRLEWLGILLDAVFGRLHIPENKKVKLRAAMAAFEAEWRGAVRIHK